MLIMKYNKITIMFSILGCSNICKDWCLQTCFLRATLNLFCLMTKMFLLLKSTRNIFGLALETLIVFQCTLAACLLCCTADLVELLTLNVSYLFVLLTAFPIINMYKRNILYCYISYVSELYIYIVYSSTHIWGQTENKSISSLPNHTPETLYKNKHMFYAYYVPFVYSY